MRHRTSWGLCAALLVAMGAGPEEKAGGLHALYLQEAAGYHYFLDPEKTQALELRREPVMRWTSDADYNGEVYVWTHQGVPGIVGCIFSGPAGQGNRSVFHEFHSLSPRRLFLQGSYGSSWQPEEPGIVLEPVPNAPAPAATPTLRLAQMREIARGFKAQVDREGARAPCAC